MSDLAFVLFGVAAVIVSITGFWLVARRQVKSVTVDIGDKVKATMETATAGILPMVVDTHSQMAQVNKAVNNVDRAAPTLIDRLGTVEDTLGAWLPWANETLVGLAERVGVTAEEPPPITIRPRPKGTTST